MKMNKLFAVLLCVILLLSAAAMAAPGIDTARNVSLTVALRDAGEALPGVQMHLYRVASVSADGKLALVAPFDKYHVELDVRGESALAGVASTLAGYVLRDKIAPAASAVTDDAGDAAYGTALKQGLYLITGQRYVYNNKVYTIQPSVVQLPLWNAADEAWVYDVAVNAKYEVQPDDLPGSTISRKVLKVWNDEGHTDSRPKEIEVQLLKDGEVFDTVTLSMKNLWRHAWTELDAAHSWTLVEKEMEDYSVVVSQEGITFVVTNSYDPENPTPTPTPSPTPSTPSGGSPGSKLPQTGQLWWPVAMLVFVGLLLIVLGLARRRGN